MLQLAMMFKDGAVLQREKPIAVWGSADPGAEVTVTVQGQTRNTTADEKGNWKVLAGPLSVSFEETLTVTSGTDTVRCSDIMVGDVWFAGGQSNMEFHMRYDADMETEKEVCANPHIRFFDYPEVSYVGELNDADYSKNYGFWRPCDRENLERFSAVAYYCVKELEQKYRVPMGILACNWGGTPAMSWVPEDVAAANGDSHRIEAYHQALAALDLQEYDRAFMNNPGSFVTDLLGDPISDAMMFGCSMEEFYGLIGRQLAAMGIDPSTLDPSQFMKPMGPKHEWRPAGVYEAMLLPCIPYGVKGILWYQGCSDSDTREDALGYRTLFPALIAHWRGLWQEDLPFLFVQLAPFGSWMTSNGTYYPLTRQAQQETADTVPGTAMAVITDVGMELDIHPKKKQPVGHRLALLARHYVYGEEDLLCEAPTLVSASLGEGRLVLTFANAGAGLSLADTLPAGEKVNGKAVGGLAVFQNGAPLDLSGACALAAGDTVTLEGPGIRASVPTRIELAKTGWYQVNLYNSAGIPARPAALDI